MNVLVQLILSESIKLKRTLAFAMVFIAPLFVVMLQILLWMNQKDGIGFDADLWMMFSRNILSMWGIFMFPLYCALVVALVYHYEHSTYGWMKMFTLPVPKWSVLLAKQLAAFLLLLASSSVLFIGTIIGGFVVDALHPAIEMPRDLPLLLMLKNSAALFGASFSIFAIQNFVSNKWMTLSVPIGVGIAGTFISLFASGWKYGYCYPWLMPIQMLFRNDGKELVSLYGSIGLGVVILGTMIFFGNKTKKRYTVKDM